MSFLTGIIKINLVVKYFPCFYLFSLSPDILAEKSSLQKATSKITNYTTNIEFVEINFNYHDDSYYLLMHAMTKGNLQRTSNVCSILYKHICLFFEFIQHLKLYYTKSIVSRSANL